MRDRQQLDTLLASLIEAGRPSSMSLPRPAGLRNFTELVQWLSGPAADPAGEDLSIAGPAGPSRLRVYRPASDSGSGSGASSGSGVGFGAGAGSGSGAGAGSGSGAGS
ncbi:MAG TPA: hypothetical protein VK162_22290, partial [Streptosporangiaceae bacterium]|nr:hypothetical protein [Streptosporangiaceae bacterium]